MIIYRCIKYESYHQFIQDIAQTGRHGHGDAENDGGINNDRGKTGVALLW